MLKQYKTGRIIILTTHYMDEADYLGDRIAIMGEGTIRTCGTSMYLKDKFGVGYTLNLFKKDEKNNNNTEVINFIKAIIPTAEHAPNISTELSFKLPLDTAPQFPTLFEQLEGK